MIMQPMNHLGLQSSEGWVWTIPLNLSHVADGLKSPLTSALTDDKGLSSSSLGPFPSVDLMYSGHGS